MSKFVPAAWAVSTPGMLRMARTMPLSSRRSFQGRCFLLAVAEGSPFQAQTSTPLATVQSQPQKTSHWSQRACCKLSKTKGCNCSKIHFPTSYTRSFSTQQSGQQLSAGSRESFRGMAWQNLASTPAPEDLPKKGAAQQAF